MTATLPLSGRRVLVTAGPTREFFDPVRFFSNPSTGKMGFAVAEAARDQGAEVLLVSGPVALSDPEGVQTVRVVSAQEMFLACESRWDACDALIATAAVADYAPVEKSPTKIKKRAEDLHLRLAATPDILRLLSARKGPRVTVGFAAETSDHLAAAFEKIEKKHLDFIVVNDLMRADSGFEVDTNKVWFLYPDRREEECPTMPKDRVAGLVIERLAACLVGKSRPGAAPS